MLGLHPTEPSLYIQYCSVINQNSKSIPALAQAVDQRFLTILSALDLQLFGEGGVESPHHVMVEHNDKGYKLLTNSKERQAILMLDLTGQFSIPIQHFIKPRMAKLELKHVFVYDKVAHGLLDVDLARIMIIVPRQVQTLVVLAFCQLLVSNAINSGWTK